MGIAGPIERSGKGQIRKKKEDKLIKHCQRKLFMLGQQNVHVIDDGTYR
jgi:hypothetical protein